MGLSFWQIALVVILFLLLFGRGKIPQLMTDVAEGVRSFRKAVAQDEVAPQQDANTDTRHIPSASTEEQL